MKTKMIFLLLAWTGAVLTLPAQTGRPVSAELKEVPLSAALKKLEQASGCSILFTYSDVQPYRVTASIRDMAVEQAVKKLLEGKPLTSVRRGEEYLIVLPDSVHRLPVAVRGRVTDEADRPLPYSNVLLLTPDSVFVNGCVSREDGSFLMTAEEGKAYLLKVSSVGYATVVQAAAAGNRIRLAPDAQMLEEVTVTGRRRLIEPSAGGVKANVAGTSLARMGTAGEMLAHLPFVTSRNGSLSVLGSGTPEIYINSRKVRDMGELDRLRASEILSAEVITAPGPEYAADVPAVIRIRTLRQRGEGWSGSVNLGYNQGRWANGDQQVALNFRTGGLDLFVKGYVSEKNSYGETEAVIRTEGKDVWETVAGDVQTSRSQRFSAEAGFNCEVNEHHSFGVKYTPGGTLGTAIQRSWGETVTSCNGTEVERADFVMRSCPRDGINHAVNAYYVGEAGRWTLDLNADYLDNRMKSSQYAEDGSEADISSVSDSESRLYAARLQAGVKLGKGQLSFGSEGTLTERKDLFTQSGFSADADNFIRQRAFAVFAGYSASWGKWRANAGLRYEHRATDYWDQGVRVEEQSPVYDELIPTASVSWSDRDLSLALAWKTMRTNPSYALLTNAVSYRTQYSYTTGNPGLEPSQAVDGAQSEDRASARSLVEAARSTVDEVSSLLVDSRLTAPEDGQIATIFPKRGELVAPGTPIMSLVVMDDAHVVLNIREDLMPQFKMGGTFRADVPAIDGKDIEFRIYYISPLGSFATWKSTKQTGSYDMQTFEIHARPTQQVEGLRPGMSVLLKMKNEK